MLLLDLLPELVHIEDARVPGPAPPLLLLRHVVDIVRVSLPVIVTVLKASVIILANEDNVFETDPGDKIQFDSN